MDAISIIQWVEGQVGAVDQSNSESIKSFVKALQEKIDKLDFKLPEGTQALGYAGTIDKTGIYKTVEEITIASDTLSSQSPKYGRRAYDKEFRRFFL